MRLYLSTDFTVPRGRPDNLLPVQPAKFEEDNEAVKLSANEVWIARVGVGC